MDGFSQELTESARARDPEFAAAYDGLVKAAAQGGALSERDRELVGLAVNAAVTHLNSEATALHIRGALDAGASTEDVIEVLQLISILGIHSVTVGLPVILEELGHEAPERFDDARLAIKDAFIERRGAWSELWNTLLDVDPDFLVAYTDFSGIPWDRGADGLSPRLRELLYVAIDAATQHMMVPGIRGHAQNAISYGATLEEFVEVLELAALCGIQSYSAGIRVLDDLEGRS